MSKRSRQRRTATATAASLQTTPVVPESITAGWRRPSPVLLFAAIAALCLVVAVGYVMFAAFRGTGRPGVSVIPPPSPTASIPIGASGDPSATPAAAAHVVFQNIDRENGYGQVATVPLTAPASDRTLTGLVCERVHVASGRGVCLVPDHGLVSTYYEILFDDDYQELQRLTLGGAPTRARVSPDGRYAAATVFVFGHSYADANFSTETTVVDLRDGTSLGNLEEFTTMRDGAEWSSEDFNFWGVTFSAEDSDRFYATVRSAGKTYLLEGDMSERTMTVLHENVECPSLSPDGTRIAYKRLTDGLIGQWRLHVLDLATMEQTALAETRNIDDQVEWLDDENVLYGDGQDIWTVPSDGTGTPSLFIAQALSPAVVR